MADAGGVTVVIPHYNRADLLENLLKQLSLQTYPTERILVVDNGSSDRSAAVARECGAEVIALGRNLGFAPAVNRGIAAASSEWVAIVNNDVDPAPDWLERLVGAASESGAWFACGKLLCVGDRSTVDGTFDLVSAAGTSWRCGSGRPDGPLWSEARTIGSAPLTAALFRRTLFDRTGPLDERFESYLEDIDLGLRCAANGLRGLYVPEAVCLHQGSATRGPWHRPRSGSSRGISCSSLPSTSGEWGGGRLWPVNCCGELLPCATARRWPIWVESGMGCGISPECVPANRPGSKCARPSRHRRRCSTNSSSAAARTVTGGGISC